MPVSESLLRNLARALADGVTKTARDRGVRTLRRYLSSDKLPEMDDMDLNIIWKSLFYAMWHSDKPLVQEELATTISSIPSVLKSPEEAVRFAGYFFVAMRTEWPLIDALRTNKFLRLARRVIESAMRILRTNNWDPSLIAIYVDCLVNGPFCSDSVPPYPPNLIMHTATVIPDAVEKIIMEDRAVPAPSADAMFDLITAPMLTYLCGGLERHIARQIMGTLETLMSSQTEFPHVARTGVEMAKRILEKAESATCPDEFKGRLRSIAKPNMESMVMIPLTEEKRKERAAVKKEVAPKVSIGQLAEEMQQKYDALYNGEKKPKQKRSDKAIQKFRSKIAAKKALREKKALKVVKNKPQLKQQKVLTKKVKRAMKREQKPVAKKQKKSSK